MSAQGRYQRQSARSGPIPAGQEAALLGAISLYPKLPAWQCPGYSSAGGSLLGTFIESFDPVQHNLDIHQQFIRIG